MATAIAEPLDIVELITDSLRRWASDRLDARTLDGGYGVPEEVRRDLADMGLFGSTIPEPYGGTGLTLGQACRIVSVLAEYDRSVATMLGLHMGLGSRSLVAFGSDVLKERYLPRLASGDMIGAFAATEPEAGSDLTGVSTRAVPVGGEMVVNGSKIYVTNGGYAGLITILAATPSLGGARRGFSLLLLERGDEGLEVGAEEDKLGLRASSTVSLHFDDVRVPVERVVGEPGQGTSHAHDVLCWGRTLMAAGCVGTARRALDLAVDHVKGRRQFGKPLSQQPVVRALVARSSAMHHAMTALVERSASMEDDRHALARSSLAAKVLCSDGAWEICDTAVQLHGGAGFIEETGVAILLRDARITRIFEGANDVLLTQAGTLRAFSPCERTSLSGRPGGEGADRLHERVRTFAAEARDRHGVHLARRPRVLHALGRLTVLSEAADAAVEHAAREPGSDASVMARHWVDIAEGRARQVTTDDGGPESDAIDDVAEIEYRRTS